MAELSDEAREEIADAARIVKEDRIYAAIMERHADEIEDKLDEIKEDGPKPPPEKEPEKEPERAPLWVTGS